MAKNILYVAENAISPIQGGGIVVAAVLQGLPAANVLGFYRYASITPALEYAERFHLLPVLSGAPAAGGGSAASPLEALPPTGINRRARELGERVRRFLAPLAQAILCRDAEYVRARVRADGFHPEVVFAAPLTLRLLRLAVAASETYDVPLILLNMDDWIAEESAHLGALRGWWERRITRAMAAAKPRLAYAYSNSARLAGVLAERYGVPHETMNNASPDIVPRARRPWSPAPAREGLVVTFAGALNWHLQGETLVRVAEAVAELRSERPVELRVFTPWQFAPLVNAISVPGAVIYGGFLGPRELADAYGDSDVLLATTTFRDERINLFRHSLATKLSDYLCAGRPVLSVGHPDWAVHDYVEGNGCGIAVRVPGRSEIKTRLVRLLETAPAERERIGRNNRRLWETAHDVRVMAARLRKTLGLADLPSDAA